jgi:hypothetical protein
MEKESTWPAVDEDVSTTGLLQDRPSLEFAAAKA